MQIVLTCSEVPEVSARSLAEFFFDLTILYDRLIIFSENAYNPILYSPNFYRRSRRLEPGLELKIGEVSNRSPLQIEFIIGAAAGVLGAAKIFVEMLRLLTELPWEIEKRRLENVEHKMVLVERIAALRQANPEVILLLERDIRRILGNEIRVLKVEDKPRG